MFKLFYFLFKYILIFMFFRVKDLKFYAQFWGKNCQYNQNKFLRAFCNLDSKWTASSAGKFLFAYDSNISYREKLMLAKEDQKNVEFFFLYNSLKATTLKMFTN